ncbi:MAG: divergent polysaccharide deacetylase family protein, partial [Thermodesulfobacteriota bacterium]|nr:divergent polysaccharide deacetylase family protein [Thermodesulfobacteriota bacterium]
MPGPHLPRDPKQAPQYISNTVSSWRFHLNSVFLDHVQEPNAIRFQIKRLVTVAKKRGQAIGIGHPYPIT